MSSKTKKASKPKKAKAAPAAEPTVEETTVPATVEEGQDQAAATPEAQDAQTPEVAEEAKAAPAAEEAATLMVLVGPNGQAGRIVLGQTVYDGETPRRMARKDFDAMRALYDLQEVKDS